VRVARAESQPAVGVGEEPDRADHEELDVLEFPERRRDPRLIDEITAPATRYLVRT
jgi:hypothetical protein